MKKSSLPLFPLVSVFSFLSVSAFATSPAVTTEIVEAPSHFTPAQLEELNKIVGGYLKNHPEAVMEALQAASEKQQKAEQEKLQKAVQTHKTTLFQDKNTPVLGNAEGTKSLVVFVDPYCGYCKKFHKEMDPLLAARKDVRVLFYDIPILGPNSILAVKGMLAAKEQGKYEEFQAAVFQLEKPAAAKDLHKIAKKLGLDMKKFKADMKGEVVKARIKHLMKLTKDLGITGTPTLIVNETEVVPGYAPADVLSGMLDGKKPEDVKKEKKANAETAEDKAE